MRRCRYTTAPGYTNAFMRRLLAKQPFFSGSQIISKPVENDFSAVIVLTFGYLSSFILPVEVVYFRDQRVIARAEQI